MTGPSGHGQRNKVRPDCEGRETSDWITPPARLRRAGIKDQPRGAPAFFVSAGRRRRRAVRRCASASVLTPLPSPAPLPPLSQSHKAGRRAGQSARQKHAASKGKERGWRRDQSVAPPAPPALPPPLVSSQPRPPLSLLSLFLTACPSGPRSSIKGGAFHPAGGKGARLQAARSLREAAKAASAAGRRTARAAPRVVGVLALSAAADAAGLWRAMAAACLASPARADGADAMAAEPSLPDPHASGALALPLPAGGPPGSSPGLLLLPLPADRADPLALVDFIRAVDVLVLAIPGDDRAHPVALDAAGEAALAILRALGPPALVSAGTLAATAHPKSGDMKARAAAKRRAAAVVADQVPGVDARAAVWWGGAGAGAGAGPTATAAAAGRADGAALARAAADARGALPRWRAVRSSLVVEAASHDAGAGTLTLTGTVRAQALSPAALVHVPGAGDFQVAAIRVLPPGTPATSKPRPASGMDLDSARPVAQVLSVPADQREPLTREHDPPEECGGVWPAPSDLAAADAALAVAASAEAAAAAALAARMRRLPPGTSEYQAAWLDADGLRGDEGDGGEEEEEEEEARPPALVSMMEEPAGGAAWADADDGAATDAAMDYQDEDEDASGDVVAARKAAAAAAADDAAWPDEVDTPPPSVPARHRFGRYRGLASWRTSAWDPADGAPPEFARVFAFENARRAGKRAAGLAAEPPAASAPVGSRVEVVLAAVPAAAAVAVAARVSAFASGARLPGAPAPPPPLTAFALLQHEGRLSVVHWAVKAAPSWAGPPLPGKADLLFVAGARAFRARPIWSTDDHGASKFKLERFLQPGRHAVASAFAPIAHAPGPLLGFARAAGGAPGGGGWALALTGTLRGCDPDRVILKKAVLTGFPAKVHKRKAVVRWMFHSPADVRWFGPCELWTKGGRRGRVREPVGTHGSFKAVFDGQVVQQDAVCLSLYKRACPPWPADVEGLWVG